MTKSRKEFKEKRRNGCSKKVLNTGIYLLLFITKSFKIGQKGMKISRNVIVCDNFQSL